MTTQTKRAPRPGRPEKKRNARLHSESGKPVCQAEQQSKQRDGVSKTFEPITVGGALAVDRFNEGVIALCEVTTLGALRIIEGSPHDASVKACAAAHAGAPFFGAPLYEHDDDKPKQRGRLIGVGFGICGPSAEEIWRIVRPILDADARVFRVEARFVRAKGEYITTDDLQHGVFHAEGFAKRSLEGAT